MRVLLCVDDSIKADEIGFVSFAYQQWVGKGQLYTVREVLDNDGIVDGLLLNEVVNQPIFQKLLGRWQEPAFRLDRFVELELEEDEEVIDENFIWN